MIIDSSFIVFSLITYDRFSEWLCILFMCYSLYIRSKNLARSGIVLLVLVQHNGHRLGALPLLVVTTLLVKILTLNLSPFSS